VRQTDPSAENLRAADAVGLHPGLFANVSQAAKAFQRAAFWGHFPISDLYREMSAKSAAFRVGGKGRGWQRAFWIAGNALEARVWHAASFGPISEWIET
jgi:hypothetical protein